MRIVIITQKTAYKYIPKKKFRCFDLKPDVFKDLQNQQKKRMERLFNFSLVIEVLTNKRSDNL